MTYRRFIVSIKDGWTDRQMNRETDEQTDIMTEVWTDIIIVNQKLN
jgi:hypothetical protein